MSSVESASMSSSEVSEKGPIAVSLKSQSDSNRLMQAAGPLRAIPSPSISRSSSYSSPHPPISNLQQKSGINRVAPGSGSPHPSIAPAPTLTKPVVTTTPTIHGTATYLFPRGSPSVGLRAQSGPNRQSVLPVSSAQSLVRTSSPVGPQPNNPSIWGSNLPLNSVRAPSPSASAPRSGVPARTAASAVTGKPGTQVRPINEVPRPLLFHSTPSRPLTITPAAQLHITGDKTMKLPVGSVAQVLRPPFCNTSSFVNQHQAATILQRADSVGSGSTVVTTPVRFNASQPPLLATQRVAVSASNTRITVQQQHLTVTSNIPQSRLPAPGLTASRGSGPPPGIQKVGGPPVATGAILATAGRLTYTGQVFSGPATVSRMPTPGTTVLTTSKPLVSTPNQLVVTTGSRMPVGNNSSGKPPRFGAVRPQGSIAAVTNSASVVVQPYGSGRPQGIVSSMPNTNTVPSGMQPAGLVVNPQLVVATGKPNHIANVRPPLTPTSTPKVIAQTIQLTTTSIASSKPAPTTLPATSTQLTPVISKQPPEVYKPAVSSSSRSMAVVGKIFQQGSAPSGVGEPMLGKMFPQGHSDLAAPLPITTESDIEQKSSSLYIPTSHRTVTSPGLICSQTTIIERSTNAPTLSTYTLPGGTSFIYEAPSGYHLAPDAPLVARPLSPDVPLVSRQLSTDGPLIARPFTPGLIATSQAMRFNPVMIVDPTISVQQTFTPASSTSTSSNDSSVLTTSTESSTTAAKITSSPRPSILRKRENDSNNPASKVARNLSTALSSGGSASRSLTPSPPTPPTSLHCETNQPTNDHGPSSNGSTTISATSSPGPEDNTDPDRPPVEMSPRKKPRKQLLNDANESIDMEFISEERIKKENESKADSTLLAHSEEPKYVPKRPSNLSLLHTYKHNWKSRLCHFDRYTDINPKGDRRPSVTELANQKNVLQRVKGWKIHHLTTQFDDLSDMETRVLNRLSTINNAMDNNLEKDLEKDISRVNDLIMGNIQRSKVIRDQMQEAKSQLIKVFDHRIHVSEIISRCASKRNFKKRDKY